MSEIVFSERLARVEEKVSSIKETLKCVLEKLDALMVVKQAVETSEMATARTLKEVEALTGRVDSLEESVGDVEQLAMTFEAKLMGAWRMAAIIGGVIAVLGFGALSEIFGALAK